MYKTFCIDILKYICPPNRNGNKEIKENSQKIKIFTKERKTITTENSKNKLCILYEGKK